MTITEARAIRALRLLEDANDGATLHGFGQVVAAIHVVSLGRKSSDAQIHGALRSLVSRGAIERTRCEGMGGALTLYRRVEAS